MLLLAHILMDMYWVEYYVINCLQEPKIAQISKVTAINLHWYIVGLHWTIVFYFDLLFSVLKTILTPWPATLATSDKHLQHLRFIR